MLNRDKIILESLFKKYGKRYILNEVKKSDKEWDMEVYTTYGGIQYATEKTPEGWSFTVDGYDGGRRWKTKPNMEKVVGTRIKRIDRYKWSDDGDDWHEVIFPDRDPNYIGGVGKNNHRAIRESLNESIKSKMTYEEIADAFCELGLREPIAQLSSKSYPEVEELINHLPESITIDDGFYEREFVIDKSKAISLSIEPYKHRIKLNFNFSKFYYDGGVSNKAYHTSVFIEKLEKKYAQNCLLCLIKILHRLDKENENSSNELSNEDSIKILNSNANKTISITNYKFKDGKYPIHISTCSFSEFTKKYSLDRMKRSASNNRRDYFEYELGGDFNEIQQRRYGRQAPELLLLGRYYIDENRFELIYDNPYEGVYTKEKVDYIPFEANV